MSVWALLILQLSIPYFLSLLEIAWAALRWDRKQTKSLRYAWIGFPLFFYRAIKVGSLKYYVEQIWPKFDHLIPSSGQLWKFYILSSLDQACILGYLPTFSCLHSFWMIPGILWLLYIHASSHLLHRLSTSHNNKDPRSYLFSIFCLCVE